MNTVYHEKKSIFERIETLIRTTGELPENFEPEEKEYADNELCFAPGALEGILKYHTAGESKGTAIKDTLKRYVQMEEGAALEKFEKEEAGDFRTASVRDGLLRDIIWNQEEYHLDKLLSLAYYFARKGTKCESVKLGLSILSIFDLSESEDGCYLLTNLGYCEEFTDYVIMNIADWEEPKKQNLYFELAKKLKGWGKINVVEEMAADTEEKKEWILCHGCRNSVMNAYLAYTCAKKCDLYERLEQGNLTEEQLRGVSDIMEGLIDEGPCAGMSALENPVKLTLLYLDELEKHALTIEYVTLLCWITDYFEKSEIVFADMVCEKAQGLLESLDLDALMAENLKDNTHQCLQVARRFYVDLSEPLYTLMQENFSKYYTYCYYLFSKERFVDEFFVLCDREIDAGCYPKEMGDSLGLGKLGDGMLALDMIVQYMGKYPLKGRKLLAISIQSPITRWRNVAGKTMLEWTKRLNQPLSQIDADLYGMVKEVAKEECNAVTKEYWQQLL